MTTYGIITNEHETQAMLDKAQKRKRVRLADLDDVKEAAKELLSILSGFINPAVYKGLKVTVYMGEAIDQLKYVKYVSPDHVGMIEQSTTAFTLLFNGDETFTVTEVKRKGHPGQRFCIAACPEGVMMIILQKYLEAGLDNWGMNMRAMAEQKEMTEIYEEECKAEAIAFSNEMRRQQEEEAIQDELEFWGRGKKCRSGRHWEQIEDGFAYQAHNVTDW